MSAGGSGAGDYGDDYYEGAAHYDRETVRFFDVAHEGAQLRVIGQSLEVLEGLRGLNPRSVVVIGTDQIALAAARLAVALRTPLSLPVLVTDRLPGYVGPLDVVLMVGERASRDEDSRALITAASRGAETILAGPARGPLLEDAPESVTILPALPTAAGPSPARTVAAVCAVLDALTALTGDVEEIRHQLDVLADEVDQELTALSPEREESVNPARQLRAFVRDSRVVHSGPEGCGAALAEFVAQLWSARGIPSGYVSPEELPAALEFAATAGAASAGAASAAPVNGIFHDPFIDGPVELVPLKAVLWAQPEHSAVPNSRAESVEEAGLGDTAQCVRLLVRAFAATALDDPA